MFPLSSIRTRSVNVPPISIPRYMFVMAMMLCPGAARWNVTVSRHRCLCFQTAYVSASGPNAATAIAYSSQRRGRFVRTSFIVGVVVALIAGPALVQANAQTPGAGQPTLLDPHPMVPHSQLTPPPHKARQPAAAPAGAGRCYCQSRAGAGKNASRDRQSAFDTGDAFGRGAGALRRSGFRRRHLSAHQRSAAELFRHSGARRLAGAAGGRKACARCHRPGRRLAAQTSGDLR